MTEHERTPEEIAAGKNQETNPDRAEAMANASHYLRDAAANERRRIQMLERLGVTTQSRELSERIERFEQEAEKDETNMGKEFDEGNNFRVNIARDLRIADYRKDIRQGRDPELHRLQQDLKLLEEIRGEIPKQHHEDYFDMIDEIKEQIKVIQERSKTSEGDVIEESKRWRELEHDPAKAHIMATKGKEIRDRIKEGKAHVEVLRELGLAPGLIDFYTKLGREDKAREAEQQAAKDYDRGDYDHYGPGGELLEVGDWGPARELRLLKERLKILMEIDKDNEIPEGREGQFQRLVKEIEQRVTELENK